jgi:hypothetical protein
MWIPHPHGDIFIAECQRLQQLQSLLTPTSSETKLLFKWSVVGLGILRGAESMRKRPFNSHEV